MVILEDTSKPEKSVKVRVLEPFRVIHPDTHEAHTDGAEVTVPQHVADEWLRSGFVEPVSKEK
jgi:hypothetical protein